MKYLEEKYLEEINAYIKGTYSQHYATNEIQVIDIWLARGTLQTTAIDTSMKYLLRYGKKEGFNRKDLLKALHYIILTLYAQDLKEEKDKNEAHPRKQLDVKTVKREARRQPTKRRGFKTQ